MGSGIIYAVLIVLWALYFVPRWLKRHEELSESRSVEKFDQAMRILSRKEPRADRRYVVMPPRPEQVPSGLPRRTQAAPTTASTRSAAATMHPSARSASRPAPRPRITAAAMRRRRILAALLLVTFAVSCLTPLTPIPWWAPVLLLVVTAGDLLHLRVQVRGSQQVDRTRRAVRRSVRSRLTRFDALDRLMSVRRELAEERAAEDARWATAEEAERVEREAEERRAADEAAGWSPVPVPLPTYVSKPMAPRRTPIAAPATTDEHPFDQHEAPTAVSPRDVRSLPTSMSALVEDADVAEDQIEAIITRRAVND